MQSPLIINLKKKIPKTLNINYIFYFNRRKMRKIISFDVADAIAVKMSYLLSLSSARILDQLIALERAAVARWTAFRTHIPKS